MKPVFLVGTRWFGVLGPCRLLIEELTARGHQVYVFGQQDEHYQQFPVEQVKLVRLNVKRSYVSFLSDLADILKLMLYVLIYRPCVVHSFNPKPAILCTSSLSLFGNVEYLMGVTGLGNTFIKARRLEPVVAHFIKTAANRAKYVFFQNNDDRALFVEKLHVAEGKVLMFQGPGVDTRRFQSKADFPSTGRLKVLLVARLLWQKGVDDFLATYERIVELQKIQFYEFTLVGEIDDAHPDRLKQSDIAQLKQTDINWIQWTDRIEDIYAENDVLLFMSKREGGPRAILEASSVGLPTIGSNCIGVKDLVIDSVSGYVVEAGDIDAIIDRLERYRLDREMISQHGLAARKMIAEKLSLQAATDAQLYMYDQIEC